MVVGVLAWLNNGNQTPSPLGPGRIGTETKHKGVAQVALAMAGHGQGSGPGRPRPPFQTRPQWLGGTSGFGPFESEIASQILSAIYPSRSRSVPLIPQPNKHESRMERFHPCPTPQLNTLQDNTK